MSNLALVAVEGPPNRFANIDIEQLSDDEQACIVTTAFELLERKHQPGRSLVSPGDTSAYLRMLLSEEKNEVFGCIWLNQRNLIVATETLSTGTLSAATVYTRVVVEKCIFHHAAAAILFHNHPSGVVEPSQSDIAITKRLKDALSLIDVRVLDHCIVSAMASTSLAERGLI